MENGSVYSECNKAKDKQHNVRKFAYAVSAVMRNYEERATASSQISKYVIFISQYAVKSPTNQDRFKEMIDNTKGRIYLLDYSKADYKSLNSIWRTTCRIYNGDISKSYYAEIITEWAIKYNFIQRPHTQYPRKSDNKDKTVITDSTSTVSEKPSEEPVISDKDHSEAVTTGNKEINHEDGCAGEVKTQSAGTNNSDTKKVLPEASDILAKKTTEELSKGKSEILSAVNASADSVIKAVAEMLAKANDDREKAAECDRLKTRLSESEQKISEQNSFIAELNDKISDTYSKCKAMTKKAEEFEARNAALEEKLKEAYSINSREESMEAEKIRSELKKAFSYMYEDWLEYEFSDVSEDNYESLQAIIKKMFRALERNGIDFKEKK